MASGLENIETIESPFRRFVTTIGVFPTAFTDAMTYYECLAYLVKYLEETVIPAVNENAEAVEELQGLYIQLKSFVDNYFDNLDVQEEINNKLDAMVEAGTLQDIIAEYLDSNVAWTFNTVADMKNATNLKNGSFARTLGFHSINDGGGATYYITNTGTADEMQIIAIGDLFANLVLPAVVNPEIFGAYHDGVHNDTPAIQKAIDTDRKVILENNYHMTSSVYIGNQDPSISGGYKKNVVLDASKSSVTYTGGNSAFVIAGVEGGKLDFGIIEATDGSCIEMWSTNGNVRVDYVKLSFNVLRPHEKGIFIHAEQTSSGTGFINEIDITGGSIFSGDYGIYTYLSRDTASSVLGLSAHRYHYIGLEGCDTGIYINAYNGRMQGFILDEIRWAENRTAPVLELHGIHRNMLMTGWYWLDPARLILSDATMYSFKVEAPIKDEEGDSTYASGILYDYYSGANQVTYLNDTYGTKTLTKAANTNGTIELDRFLNQVVINFAGIGSSSVNQTIVNASDMPITPIKRAFCTVTSTNNKTAYVDIATDGTMTIHRASGDNDERYYGQMTILSHSPKRGV